MKLDIIILYCLKAERRAKGHKAESLSAATINLYALILFFTLFIVMLISYIGQNYFIIKVAAKRFPGYVYASIPAILFFLIIFIFKKIRRVSYSEKKEIIIKYQNKRIRIARVIMFLLIPLFFVLTLILGILQKST